jgi:catechol 2,3-dioxygenase-like lactoylglutathione lyase family enzyme
MTDTTPGLIEMTVVVLAVRDQERSLRFYVDSLGLEKRTDTPFGDGDRWIEVAPAGARTGVALAPPPPGTEVTPRNTGITFSTADIDATHGALTAAGVDVDEEIARMGDPVPPMFWLRDPDGYTLLVVEAPRA